MLSYLNLLRPHQWMKNLMLIFPPFLGGSLLQIESVMALILPLFSFSSAASSIYIVNDLMDMKQDIHHPEKCRRPIPAGEIAQKSAFAMAIVLLAGSVFSGSFVSIPFLLCLFLYLIISFAYSWQLKTIAIVEMFCVVSGFLIRLIAGGVAFNIQISNWLFLSVFWLALYLVSGKRLGEIKYADGPTPDLVRPVLAKYPEDFLVGCMYISGAAALVTYAMYALDHPMLVYTVPLCCFGLLAFLFRTQSGRGGDPTWALLKDPIILGVGIVWVIFVALSIYTKLPMGE